MEEERPVPDVLERVGRPAVRAARHAWRAAQAPLARGWGLLAERAGEAAGRGGGPADVPAPAGLAVLEEVLDTFDDDRPPGEVVGSWATSGGVRQGIDVESTIGIDNGALRLAPLRVLGFGRQGIAYGPFRRRDGLALAVRALNSHHAAQTNLLHQGRKAALRRVVANLPRGPFRLLHIADSLAVGFQAEPVPAEPRGAGAGFVVRSAGVVNGELTARVGTGRLRAHAGIEELPITYVVVLRERGAVCYASSLPGAAGLGAHPSMRPVAIDHADDTPLVWASVQQAVHGEVGHELASRIERVQVRHVEALAGTGSALAADALRGAGRLDAGSAEVGGRWRLVEGRLERSAAGTSGAGVGGAAVVELEEPAGLVHVVLATAAHLDADTRAGLLWRAGPDGRDGWRLTLWPDRAELAVGHGGLWEVVASGPAHLPAGAERSLQVLDDGHTIGAHLDGELLFGRWFEDDRHAGRLGAGVLAGPGAGVHVVDFEAQPVAVALPPEIDPGPPWSPEGGAVLVEDAFEGPRGELAAAVAAGRAGPAWARSFGAGRFDLTGDGGLAVRAGREAPNPGRTCYTVPWPDPGFADVAVTVHPPGSGRGEGHGSRAGIVLWQDEDTHMIVNAWLDDTPDHDGSAISLFFRDRGYERLYDAPWANVGRRVRWGEPFRLRVVSDGCQVLAHLDDEPVLYRRATDLYPTSPGLRLERVGVVANYEWGDDTGSRFSDFTARGR